MAEKIVVFGIGRVGLPLALVLADTGYEVSGIDIDPFRIALIEKKAMPFIEEGADELLQKYGGNRFRIFSKDHTARVVAESKYIILTLGTPIDETYSPDHKQIEGLFLDLYPYLKKGHVIILRSTISPGTTERLTRQLEENTKLKVGRDVFLAYCPERIAEGKSVEELYQIPQIIGSVDPKSKLEAGKVFSKIAPENLYTTPRAAELSKLYCNMYRYIDFAVGNEFMMIAENYGADIYEVLKLVNHGYKRAGLKSPGFTAGPCLVKDGFFLIDKSPFMDLVIAAWRLNENVPGYVAGRIKEEIGSLTGKKVALLGLSFKKDIDDVRFSLTPKLERYFSAEGAKVSIHDPFLGTESFDSAIEGAEVLVVSMNHSDYKKLTLKELSKHISKNCLIYDIWNHFGTDKTLFYLKDFSNEKTKKKNA